MGASFDFDSEAGAQDGDAIGYQMSARMTPAIDRRPTMPRGASGSPARPGASASVSPGGNHAGGFTLGAGGSSIYEQQSEDLNPAMRSLRGRSNSGL